MNWESRFTPEPRQIALNAVDRMAALILTVGLLLLALYGVCRLLGVIS